MDTRKEDFKKWFVESLKPLEPKGDAGFIFLLTGFPLLERYLRNKSGCPEHNSKLTGAFFTNLSALFPEVAGRVEEFWHCYRNGLLHQVTFATIKYDKEQAKWISGAAGSISGYDPRPIYFDPAGNGFFVNPVAFFEKVTTEILANFSVYEATAVTVYPLPSLLDPCSALPSCVPTIVIAPSWSSRPTGSRPG